MRIYDSEYQKIVSLMNESRKNGDTTRLETLKMIKWELEKGEKSNGKVLTDADEEKILMAMVNKYNKSIEAYESEGLKEEADKIRIELAIIKEYAPRILSDDEIIELVENTINAYIENQNDGYKLSMRDMKPIMEEAKKTYSSINGKIVKDLLEKHF